MVGERELTARLRAFFPSRRDVAVGLGDDAAVVRPGGDRVALCCDPVVEGVHFEASTARTLVGRKAVNRNLSDLAAMGAEADWLLVSVVLPKRLGSGELMQVLRGVRSAAGAAGAVVVGGDVSSGDGPLVVTVSAFGRLRGRALTRDALRVGDSLHCTGALGGSIAGHHLRFLPALAEGRWLAGQDGVRAAMDVSDGLVLDLATMLRASGATSGALGAELDAAAIPVRAAARRLAQGDPEQALQRALHDGEDHVLLFSVRKGHQLAAGGPLTARARRPIGRVVREPGITLVAKGRRERLPIVGFEHRLDR